MFSNTITCLDELSGEWKNTFFWMLRSRVLNMVQSAVQSRLLTVHSQSSMQNSVTAWLRGRCKCSSVSRPHELEPQGFRMKRECGNRRRNAEKWHFFQMWTTKRERTLGVSVTIRSKKEKKKNAHKQPPVVLQQSRRLLYRSSHAAVFHRCGRERRTSGVCQQFFPAATSCSWNQTEILYPLYVNAIIMLLLVTVKVRYTT